MSPHLKQLFSKDNIAHLREQKWVRLVGRLLQTLLVGLMFYILIDTLEDQNWGLIAKALPTNPFYYLLFLIWYFAIPATELLVYRLMWGVNLIRHAGIFLRKRVYNLALVSYSGEAYLAFWARRRFGLSDKQIFSTVKDSNVLSALSSNLFTLILLVVFFATGQWRMLLEADGDFIYYVGLAMAVGLVLVPVILRFRKSIISLPGTIATKVVLVHFMRFIVMLVCQVGIWAVVLPEVPITTWLFFITAQLILTRVPFLPNTDLILTTLGIAMAGVLNAPKETVSGMFLAYGVLSQLLNLLIYFITSFQNARPHGSVIRGGVAMPVSKSAGVDGYKAGEAAE